MAFYEETNPADITVEKIIPSINQFLPKIKAEDISFFYHGTYNVFDIQDEYILRVPDREYRNSKGLNMLRRENNILQFLSTRLPTPVPDILFLHDSEILPFSIHKKIPGKSLVFVIEQLTQKEKLDIAVEIGKTLSILHSESISQDYISTFPKWKEQFPQDELFLSNYKKKWAFWFEETKEYAYQYLNGKQKKWLKNIFDEFLSDKNNFRFKPKVSHCDFDTSNILINLNSYQISGLIDFEECNLWDPAVDLLFFNEGEEFMNKLLENYKFSNQKSLRNRMKFYYSRTCTPYIVWGIQHNRPSMIDEGIRRIMNNMKMFP